MRYRGLMRFFAGASATGIALASLVANGSRPTDVRQGDSYPELDNRSPTMQESA